MSSTDAYGRTHPTLESLAESMAEPGSETAATLAHLTDCPECQAQVRALRELEAGLASLGDLVMPDDVWQRQVSGLDRARLRGRGRIHPRWIAGAVAASFAGAALILGVVDLGGGDDSITMSDSASQDLKSQEGVLPDGGAPLAADAAGVCSVVGAIGSESWRVPVPAGADLTVAGPAGISVTFGEDLTRAHVTAPPAVRIVTTAYVDGSELHTAPAPGTTIDSQDHAITDLTVCYLP